MTSIIALTLAATLSNPAALPPETAAEPRPALLTQAARLAERLPLTAPDAGARLRFAPPGGDSLKNGAIIGGVIAGGAMLLWAARICRETSCAPDALMWSGLAGGLGALVGAGIDALFDGAPAARVRFR